MADVAESQLEQHGLIAKAFPMDLNVLPKFSPSVTSPCRTLMQYVINQCIYIWYLLMPSSGYILDSKCHR